MGRETYLPSDFNELGNLHFSLGNLDNSCLLGRLLRKKINNFQHPVIMCKQLAIGFDVIKATFQARGFSPDTFLIRTVCVCVWGVCVCVWNYYRQVVLKATEVEGYYQ
jgi:hypothetical protein